MKILLYGGTFDPPHNGHFNNLVASAQRILPDKVIVMPAGVPPHKRASDTPADIRLRLCQCFLQCKSDTIPEITISDWEVQQAAKGVRNYTVTTLEMLRKAYPQAELYLCIGSDMLLIFTSWYRWRDILHLATLVVESREEGDLNLLSKTVAEIDPSGARILFASAPAVPMASNELRTCLEQGVDCSKMLPSLVNEMIAKEGLYLHKHE